MRINVVCMFFGCCCFIWCVYCVILFVIMFVVILFSIFLLLFCLFRGDCVRGYSGSRLLLSSSNGSCLLMLLIFNLCVCHFLWVVGDGKCPHRFHINVNWKNRFRFFESRIETSKQLNNMFKYVYISIIYYTYFQSNVKPF